MLTTYPIKERKGKTPNYSDVSKGRGVVAGGRKTRTTFLSGNNEKKKRDWFDTRITRK